MYNYGRLERGEHRIILLRELAIGTLTQGQLAEKYGVTQQSISDFRERHAAEIAEIAADLGNELAGLWVADRKRMLAALQDDAEALAALAGALEGEPDTAVGVPGAMNSRRMALDLAAKVAGLLRDQVDINVTTVEHQVVGVDPEELT